MIPLLASDFFDILVAEHGDQGGAYVVHATTADGAPMSVGRVLGDDQLGMLYIGRGKSFRSRVAFLSHTLRNSHFKKKHEFVRRYNRHPGLESRFRSELLMVKLYPSPDPVAEERRLLNDYFNEFGEVPPFNRAS